MQLCNMYFHIALRLGTLDSKHFSTMLGGHFKQQILNKKHKTVKNMALNKTQKGHFMVWELKQEGKALLVLPLLGMYVSGLLKFFAIPWMSTKDHRVAASIDLRVKNKF